MLTNSMVRLSVETVQYHLTNLVCHPGDGLGPICTYALAIAKSCQVVSTHICIYSHVWQPLR